MNSRVPSSVRLCVLQSSLISVYSVLRVLFTRRLSVLFSQFSALYTPYISSDSTVLSNQSLTHFKSRHWHKVHVSEIISIVDILRRVKLTATKLGFAQSLYSFWALARTRCAFVVTSMVTWLWFGRAGVGFEGELFAKHRKYIYSSIPFLLFIIFLPEFNSRLLVLTFDSIFNFL